VECGGTDDFSFQCGGTTPANAEICHYSATDSARRDDRELNRADIEKKLIGEPSNRCLSATDTSPKPNNVLHGQLSRCNNTNDPTKQTTEKCEFYCPNGWHREMDGNCHPNSCAYNPVESKRTRDGRSVVFTPRCMAHGDQNLTTFVSTNTRVNIV
jgi:hypothetical protein